MLTVCIGSEGGEDLELSSSEDEREKEERLGKEALKSFALSYTKVTRFVGRLCFCWFGLSSPVLRSRAIFPRIRLHP